MDYLWIARGVQLLKSTMPTLRTVTLGCKVNQYETELVRTGLTGAWLSRRSGKRAGGPLRGQYLHGHARRGCQEPANHPPAGQAQSWHADHCDGLLCHTRTDELAELPGVVEVVTDKRELPDILGRFGVVDLPTGISTFANHQRAYIKVQDGCMLHCSFCIIPHVRPHLASRPPEHISAEIKRLYFNGYREFVLTGIHLGHYGVEWNRGRPKQ